MTKRLRRSFKPSSSGRYWLSWNSVRESRGGRENDEKGGRKEEDVTPSLMAGAEKTVNLFRGFGGKLRGSFADKHKYIILAVDKH